MPDFAAIIEGKGGPAAFAAAVGSAPGTVRVWKHRILIPRDSWPEVMMAFDDLTLAVLIEAEALSAAARAAAARDVPQPETAGAAA